MFVFLNVDLEVFMSRTETFFAVYRKTQTHSQISEQQETINLVRENRTKPEETMIVITLTKIRGSLG